jgi:hypothetical protein
MAKKEENAVVEVKAGALATVPEFMDVADFGAGFEGTDKDSYAIPFLQVLQKMSPLVDEDSPKYIEGAKAGMFFNTVTGRLYDGKNGLTVIPCAYKRSFIQWGAREAGGGFKGEFTPEHAEQMVAEGKWLQIENRIYVPDENGKVDPKKQDYVADTRSHFIVGIDPETNETFRAILSLASSQIKASRNLMTSLSQKKVTLPDGSKRTPPTFANLVQLTTVGQTNDQGSWSGVVFKLDGTITDKALFEEAKDFHKSIAAGEVKVDYSKAADDGTSASDKPQEAEGF